jgi:hypothetical protein
MVTLPLRTRKKLADLDLVVVEVADDLGAEELVEARELLGEVDLLGRAHSVVSIWARWSLPE